MRWDILKDFELVSLVAAVEWGLVAGNQTSFKSAADLIAAAGVGFCCARWIRRTANGCLVGPNPSSQCADELRSPPTETLHGVVESVDQRSDAIRLRLSSGTAEQFKVQDGLMFDAVRFGDAVEVLVQSVDGLRTIVSLLEK